MSCNEINTDLQGDTGTELSYMKPKKIYFCWLFGYNVSMVKDVVYEW